MELTLKIHKIVDKHHGLKTISSNMQMFNFSLSCHLEVVNRLSKCPSNKELKVRVPISTRTLFCTYVENFKFIRRKDEIR